VARNSVIECIITSMCVFSHPENRKVKLLFEFHPPVAKYICIIIGIGAVLFPPIIAAMR